MMVQADAKPENQQLVLLRTLIAVIITGLGFGFVMAFVSNWFVLVSFSPAWAKSLSGWGNDLENHFDCHAYF